MAVPCGTVSRQKSLQPTFRTSRGLMPPAQVLCIGSRDRVLRVLRGLRSSRRVMVAPDAQSSTSPVRRCRSTTGSLARTCKTSGRYL